MQFLIIQKPARARQCCLQTLLGFGLALGIYAAQPDAGLKIPEPSPSLSEFTDDPKFGKDPFFPNSIRRQATNEVAPEAVKAPAISKIKLMGISMGAGKRFAVLNGRTFAAGEEAEMKIDGQSYRVRLIEIRDRSVMVSINGQPPQELFMRQRF